MIVCITNFLRTHNDKYSKCPNVCNINIFLQVSNLSNSPAFNFYNSTCVYMYINTTTFYQVFYLISFLGLKNPQLLQSQSSNRNTVKRTKKQKQMLISDAGKMHLVPFFIISFFIGPHHQHFVYLLTMVLCRKKTEKQKKNKKAKISLYKYVANVLLKVFYTRHNAF